MKIKKLKIKLNKDNEYSDYRYFIPKSNNIKMTDGRDVDEAVQSLKDKIANLKEQANYLIDKAPLVKYAEGTSITITDCAEAPLRKFSIEGDSYQETREGYNKAKYTSDSTNVNFDIGDIETGKTYSLYIKVNGYVSFNLKYGSTGSTIATEYSVTGERVYKIESTQNAVLHFNGFTAELGVFVSVNNIMLLEGEYTLETLPPYEQYGVSPSIEYEAPIESVGDNINLFDKDNASTLNGYLYNGKIVSSDNTNTIIIIAIKPNKTYSISKMLQATANKNRLSLGTTTDYPVAGATLNVAKINSDGTTKTSETITSSENDNYLVAQIYTKDTTSLEEMLSSIKIVEGISTGAYSPYGQGSIEIYNGNKNLFNISKYPFTQRVAYNGDKLVWWTGYYGIQGYFPVKEQETYSFSNDLGLPIAFGLVFYDKDKNAISSISKDTTTFTTPEKCKYIRFAIKSATLPTWVQIEKGETATEYIPHQSQTKALYTQQPFKAIGDVKDKFVKKASVWYEEHKIFRKIFNGTENWLLGSPNYRYYIEINNKAEMSNIDITPLSSRFVCVSGTEIEIDYDTIWLQKLSDSSFRINIFNTNYLSDLANFKKWLTELYNAGTPVYVDYILETPTLIPCTAEQVEILDSLQSYDKITYYSVDKTNNVQANIKLIYKQDINAILEGEGV